jgi:anti-sigma regulatory factor (Ser/Thr protein kinase)
VDSDFERAPESVRAARQFVLATLASWDLDDMGEVASLLTSELVTNAVLHAKTAFHLSVQSDDDREVLIEVTDGSDEPPVRGDARPDAEGGRGLVLVASLASRWGTRLGPRGKAVWFCLERDARARPDGLSAVSP